MKKVHRLCMAAAAVGAVLVYVPATGADPVGQNAADKTGNTIERNADRIGETMQNTGDAMRNAAEHMTTPTTKPADQSAPDAKGIRKTLAQVAEASLTKGGFDDLVERFANADRTRLGKDGFTEKDQPKLDGRIEQFQKDWKAKYNQEFSVSDVNAVYTDMFASISQGEVGNDAQLAGSREEPNPNAGAAAPGTGSGAGGISGQTEAPGNTPAISGADKPHLNNATDMTQSGEANHDAAKPMDSQKTDANDSNLEPGRSSAVVVIAASHGLPEVRVPMVHEFPDRWKIDVPDSCSAEQLHDNLLKQLTAADEMKDQWPADVNDAYRAITHRVLLAVMNVNDQPDNAAPAGMK